MVIIERPPYVCSSAWAHLHCGHQDGAHIGCGGEAEYQYADQGQNIALLS
ncbi:MAG: hypothetical protein GY696_22365 [Gammaproteobacteria bacterium]|nr:hypothetical protein [Gammaproteobacteria bacterium]